MSEKQNRIDIMRKAAGFTQEGIAQQVGVARSTYIAWIRQTDPVPIPADKLVMLAELFNCSCDYLLGLSDFQSYENALISEKTGLAEESIDLLKNAQNEANTHRKLRAAIAKTGAQIKVSPTLSEKNPVALVIDFLLRPENTKRNDSGLVYLLYQYLTVSEAVTFDGENTSTTIPGKNGATVTIDNRDLLLGGLIGMIQTRLVEYRAIRKKRVVK